MRSYVAVFLIVSILSVLHPSGGNAQTIPQTDLRRRFLSYEEEYRSTWHNETVDFYGDVVPADDGAHFSWIDGPYALMSYIDAYEVFGEEVWLDRFQQRADQIVAYATEDNGFIGWPTSKYDNGVRTRYMVTDCTVASALARFDGLIASRGIAGHHDYGWIVDRILSQWESGIFLDETPMNYTAHYGITAFYAGRNTAGISKYIQSKFKRSGETGLLYWDYSTRTGLSDDISHAGATVVYMGLASDQFTAEQHEDILRTVLSVELPDGTFRSKLSGENSSLIPDDWISPVYQHIKFDARLYPLMLDANSRIERSGHMKGMGGVYMQFPIQLLKYQNCCLVWKYYIPTLWRND